MVPSASQTTSRSSRPSSKPYGQRGVDLVLSAAMSFANGVVATFDCGLKLPERARLEVLKGHTGAIPLESVARRRTLRRAAPRRWVERIEVEAANAYGWSSRTSHARRAPGKEPLIGRAEAVAQARAIEALLASAAGNEPVEAKCRDERLPLLGSSEREDLRRSPWAVVRADSRA